jgi:hypothetical protein
MTPAKKGQKKMGNCDFFLGFFVVFLSSFSMSLEDGGKKWG